MNRLSLFVLGALVCGTGAATTCDADAMDLCEDLGFSCAADALDLCLDDDTTTTSQVATSQGAVGSTTTGQGLSVKTGSFTITVDATPTQVKASTEKAMGKLLYDQGVGSSALEAAGYVEAVVNTATRRLSEFSRQLASTQYTVGYTISVPFVSGVDTKLSNTLTAISTDPTILQTEMVNQFKAANVATATTVTISGFSVSNNFEGGEDTAAASRLIGTFSTTCLVLASCFTSMQLVLAA